jgi:hypothetical protein
MGSTPEEIVAGPDGNLWVTLSSRHGVARVTPAGAVTEFLLPSAAGNPTGITVGPDGALWVSLAQYPGVARVGLDGVVGEVPVPGVGPRGATGIAVGPDGALWLAYPDANRIGRLTVALGYSEVALRRRGAKPLKIVGAPSGVWFTENGRDRIGRVTPAATPTGFGPIREFGYDATPPRARVTVSAAAARASLRRGRLRLPARVRCNEACAVRAELWASKALAARLGVRGSGGLVRLGTTRRGLARNRVVRVSLRAAISRRLAARPGSRLTLRVFATDRGANTVRVTRRVRV